MILWKLNIDMKSVIFFNEGTFTRISSMQFRNEMTFRVSAKPWFIYRIKVLYDKGLLSELAKNVMCSLMSLLQCIFVPLRESHSCQTAPYH